MQPWSAWLRNGPRKGRRVSGGEGTCHRRSPAEPGAAHSSGVPAQCAGLNNFSESFTNAASAASPGAWYFCSLFPSYGSKIWLGSQPSFPIFKAHNFWGAVKSGLATAVWSGPVAGFTWHTAELRSAGVLWGHPWEGANSHHVGKTAEPKATSLDEGRSVTSCLCPALETEIFPPSRTLNLKSTACNHPKHLLTSAPVFANRELSVSSACVFFLPAIALPSAACQEADGLYLPWLWILKERALQLLC